MSKSPAESRVPLVKRSGLPRLAASSQHLSNLTKSSLPISTIKASHKAYVTKPRRIPPQELFDSFEEESEDIGRHFKAGKSTKGERHAWKRYATDESSPFSRQLAKIAKGSDSDLYLSCQAHLPRPAWPADGSLSESSAEQLSKEYVGRRVVVGEKEQGTLRYFGRTAFASGLWCGVELDRPLGKNDGSVDGVIYFSCSIDRGIFAPSDKVSLLPILHHPEMRSKRSRCDNPLSEISCRLSTISNSSSSSGGSALSTESQKRLSSGASSSATFTIATREEIFTDYSSSPTYHKSSSSSQLDAEGSDVISPADGTFEDSSFGILSPDQMPDFSGPNSLEKSGSDENIAGIELDPCELGAVGGYIRKWKSRENSPEFADDLIQEDISAIIEELYSHEMDSDSPPKSIEYQKRSPPAISNTERAVFATSAGKDISVRPKTSVRINPDNKITDEVQQTKDISIDRSSPYRDTLLPVNVEFSPKRELKPDKNHQGWTTGNQSNMTLSAASLDQGYQGDLEFDVPSEAGSITASSPTENHRIFEKIEDIQQTSTYSNISQADTSMAEDETESESIVIPKDRRIRIIDGKFYHGHKEITTLRQFDMRTHDPLSSEMDSSGFYSDLDHREDDSTRMEISLLKPLEESTPALEMDDSAIEDTTQLDEEYSQSNFDSKEREICSLDDVNEKEVSLVKQTDIDESASCLQTNLVIDGPVVASPKSLIDDILREEYSDGISVQTNEIQANEESLCDAPIDNDLFSKLSTPLPDEQSDGTEDMVSEQEKLRPKKTYEKPWLKRTIPKKRSEKPRPVIAPPPPMPKKDVQSKLKMMLEAKEPPSEDRRQRLPAKKGRWDDVMSKIEEGKKEDTLKPKVKEVKSKIMESLKTQNAPSPQVEKMRQERKERREKRERQVAARMFSDRKRSSASTRTSRAPSLESVNAGLNLRFERENSTISQASSHSKAGTEVISNIRRPKVDTARGIQPKKNIRKISEPVKVGRPTVHSNRVTNNNTYHFTDELKQKDAELCINKALVVRYREESRHNRTGLEALSIIIQHLSTEYDPFSTPQLKRQVERLCSKLDQLKLNLDDSSATVLKLQREAQKATEEHEERIQVLQERNNHELSQLRDHHTNDVARINSEHSKKLYDVWEEERSKRKTLEESHLLDLDKAKSELHGCLEATKREQAETVEILKTSHLKELKECESQAVLKEKEYQSEKLKLEKEKEILREQAKRLERTLLSDKDHKLQAARGVCAAMEKEVDSLKTVIEMRNGEIHQLRDKVVDRETLTDTLQAAREKIRTLRAKTEDLTEQMDKKSESERQWYAEYRQMSDSLQRESCINRRLAQDNEELQWKIRNRELNLSSIGNDSSSQDLLSRSGHQSFMDSSHKQFSSSPKQLNKTISCDKRNGRSFASLDDSFNIKSLADSNFACSGMKTMIEKSNSVSFILDLDSCGKSETPVRPRDPKRPVLKLKKGVAKSTSTPHVNGDRHAPVVNNSRKVNGLNRTKLHLSFASNENLRHGRQQRSSCSTSESSDGCELERISPTGVAWTVPADGAKKCLGKEEPSRSLLQHPVEDEYEEEAEFIGSLELVDSLQEIDDNTLIAHPLSNILEGRDSASPSDSDASQCGSRVELSTDSDSSDDDGTEMAGLTTHWVIQEGAGEAMVAKDALGSRHSDITDKDSDRPQSNMTSLFSSDSEDVLGKGSLTMSWSEDCDLTSSSEMQDF